MGLFFVLLPRLPLFNLTRDKVELNSFVYKCRTPASCNCAASNSCLYVEDTKFTFLSFYCFVIADVGQLQNFVQVALATSGEGDMIRDLLSQLHTVGSSYAPLIYDLPKDAYCQALVGRCKGVWGDLDKHPNLSQILVGSYELSIIPFLIFFFMLTFT